MNAFIWAVAALFATMSLVLAAMVTGAAADSRSIIFTLPLATVLGLAIAGFGIRLRSRSMILYGLAPLVLSLHFVIAFILPKVPPGSIEVGPVFLAFQLLVTPLAVLALLRIAARGTGARTRWQIDLRNLFTLMLVVAAASAAARAVSLMNAPRVTIIAWAFAVGSVGLLMAIAHRKGGHWSSELREAWSLKMLRTCVLVFAVAPYISGLLVREYPNPVTPWETVQQIADWHLPALMLFATLVILAGRRRPREHSEAVMNGS